MTPDPLAILSIVGVATPDYLVPTPDCSPRPPISQDPSSSSTSERATSLAAKLSTATSVLTSPTPALHSLALEVLSNGLLVHHQVLSPPPPEWGGGKGGPLTLTLGGMWPLLDSLLDHFPQGWSPRLFKVRGVLCVSMSVVWFLSCNPQE